MCVAFTESLRIVYVAMTAVSLVATLASLATRHYDVDRKLETAQGLEEAKAAGEDENQGRLKEAS